MLSQYETKFNQICKNKLDKDLILDLLDPWILIWVHPDKLDLGIRSRSSLKQKGFESGSTWNRSISNPLPSLFQVLVFWKQEYVLKTWYIPLILVIIIPSVSHLYSCIFLFLTNVWDGYCIILSILLLCQRKFHLGVHTNEFLVGFFMLFFGF